MHGYPGDLLPPGCRLPPPPGPLHGPHEILYGSPPDMVLHPPTDMDPSCSPDDWSQDPPPGTDLYPRPDTEPVFGYLDTSDDSGRHTGPDPSSP